MSERTDDLEDVEADLIDDTDLVDDADVEHMDTSSGLGSVGEERTVQERSGSESGRLSGVGNPLSSLFSVRWFGLATAASVVGVVLAGGIPLPFSGFLGIFAVTAAIGLLKSTRHYVEVAIAGAIAAGIAVFLDVLVLVFVGIGIPLVAIGTLLGAVVGVLGHYVGRDLRHGMTRDL